MSNVYIIEFDIRGDIGGDNILPLRPEIMEQLLGIAERVRQEGATSPETALSLEEIVDRTDLESAVGSRLESIGVLVESDGKYYVSEERLEKVKGHLALREHARDAMHDVLSPPLRRMLRHTASVPKGFLRYHVLRLLDQRPMSGSEIMEEIGKETGGRWKPSPGSVYPLLAWLQEKGYTEEVPREMGEIVKRYALTGKGRRFSEGQSKLQEELRKRMEFFAPPFLGGFWLSPNPEKLAVILPAATRLARALFSLGIAQEEGPSDEMLSKVAMHLNTAAEGIEEISRNLQRNDGSAKAD